MYRVHCVVFKPIRNKRNKYKVSKKCYNFNLPRFDAYEGYRDNNARPKRSERHD